MMLDDIVSRGRGGPPGQFHDNANGGQNGTVQEIMIPAGKAGLVIGKGGETIKQLQVREWAAPLPRKFLPGAVRLHATAPAALPGSFILSYHIWPPTRPRESFESSALTLNLGCKGTGWSEDDFNPRWIPEHKRGQTAPDHWRPLQSTGERTLGAGEGFWGRERAGR